MEGSRKFDLEQLSEMLQRRDLSPKARYEIEETMKKIVHESAPVRSLREELVRATRGGDIRAIRRIQTHIHAIRQEETQGREF